MNMPPSQASVPLTEEQIQDLKFMCNPVQWPFPQPILQLKNYHRDDPDKAYEPATLVFASMVHRYLFYPGLSIHMGEFALRRHLETHAPQGPYLAYELEALVRAGWEVD